MISKLFLVNLASIQTTPQSSVQAYARGGTDRIDEGVVFEPSGLQEEDTLGPAAGVAAHGRGVSESFTR